MISKTYQYKNHQNNNSYAASRKRNMNCMIDLTPIENDVSQNGIDKEFNISSTFNGDLEKSNEIEFAIINEKIETKSRLFQIKSSIHRCRSTPDLTAIDQPTIPKVLSSIELRTENEEKEVDRKDEMEKTKTEPLAVDIPKDMSPDEYLKHIIQHTFGFRIEPIQSLSMSSHFFPLLTAENYSGYTCDVVRAVTESNINYLRSLHKSGTNLFCCNKFGESILHMACRRGLSSVVKFLLLEAKVSTRVRDDLGRTPMHDACWNSSPNWEIMDYLLRIDPILLFLSDKRGFTPFQYSKREKCDALKLFLREKTEYLIPFQHILKLIS